MNPISFIFPLLSSPSPKQFHFLFPMQAPRRKTSLPVSDAVAMKHGGGGRKGNNLSVFVVVFSIFLFAGFMYNEDVKSIAEFPFSRQQQQQQQLSNSNTRSIHETLPQISRIKKVHNKHKEKNAQEAVQLKEEEDGRIQLPVAVAEEEEVEEEEEEEEEAMVEIPKEDCDLFTGEWVFDNVTHPIYKEDDCEFLTAQVTCMRNGRKDSLYQNWKWQPRDCSLPK